MTRRRRSDRFRMMIEDRAIGMADNAIRGVRQQAVERKTTGPAGGLREKRIEWVTWGISFIILGLAIVSGIGTPIGKNDALWFVFPASAGGLMLLSAFLQKIISNWNVSVFTWTLSTLLLALAIERFIALFIVLNRSFNFVFYVGGLIILAGLIILLQIFRRA